jgi:hypothetical protein
MECFPLSLSLLISLIAIVHGQCTNGSTIRATDGAEYLSYCGLNFPGNDLSHLSNVTNMTDCINLCEAWNQTNGSVGCTGVSLTSGSDDGFLVGCWLKYSMGPVGVVENDEGYVVDSEVRIRSNATSSVSAVLASLLQCQG